MFCSNCGKKLSDDAKFCSFCGTQINYITSQTLMSEPSKDLSSIPTPVYSKSPPIPPKKEPYKSESSFKLSKSSPVNQEYKILERKLHESDKKAVIVLISIFYGLICVVLLLSHFF